MYIDRACDIIVVQGEYFLVLFFYLFSLISFALKFKSCGKNAAAAPRCVMTFTIRLVNAIRVASFAAIGIVRDHYSFINVTQIMLVCWRISH